MTPQRITVKLFAKPGTKAGLPKFIALFHKFIQNKTLEGLLVDVADYEHVPDGPGIVLIGHDVDYAMDMAGGRPGLLVRRKRYHTDLADVLRDTIRKALRAVEEVEADGSTGMKFSLDAVEITAVDKLATPNTDAGYTAIRPAVESVLRELFSSSVLLTRGDQDPRKNLSVTARLAPQAAAV